MFNVVSIVIGTGYELSKGCTVFAVLVVVHAIVATPAADVVVVVSGALSEIPLCVGDV